MAPQISPRKPKTRNRPSEYYPELDERRPSWCDGLARSGTLNAEFDADKHLHAERLDGCYLLKTSRKDLSSDELWRIYVLLTRAENAFRDLKSPLAERPIWHRLERRVNTHSFLCVLAYHLLISIEKTLLDNSVHTSWATIRDILKTHQICTIVLPTDDSAPAHPEGRDP